jgi:cytochrome c-type biogenesis protein CcmH/NrfG
MFNYSWPNIPELVQHMQDVWMVGACLLLCTSRAATTAHGRINNNKLRMALASAESAVRFNPQDADAWFDLGDARAALKDYFGARDAFAYATVLNPEDGEALYHQARSCAVIGEKGEASDLVAKAIALDPRLLPVAASDTAFNAVRNHSPFRELLR